MNNVFEFISNVCPITDNDLVDTILFSVITLIAFKVAWSLVGAIADGTDFHDSSCMSFLHWIIRLIVFAGLLAAFIGLVHLIRWITSWPWWVYLIVAIVFILIIIGIILLVHFSKKSKNNKEENKDTEKNEGE